MAACAIHERRADAGRQKPVLSCELLAKWKFERDFTGSKVREPRAGARHGGLAREARRVARDP
jgi:hypothetical protein